MADKRTPLDGEAYARRVAAVIRNAYPATEEMPTFAAAPLPVRRQRWPAFIAPAALVAATLAVWILARRPPAPLRYTLEGAELHDGRVITARHERSAILRFSEGSEVRLADGSESLLEAVTARGAALRVRRGSAHISVTPRPKAQWNFMAGPYRVEVLGTRFTLAWQPAHESLEVRMEKGRVRITGPLLPEGVTLLAGQRLAVSRDRAGLLITRTEREQPDESAPARPAEDEGTQDPRAAAAPPPTEAPVVAEAPSRKPAQRAVQPPTRVAEIVGRGSYAQALNLAKKQDLAAFVATASARDLSALADAARYENDFDVARRALAAQRARFAHTRAGAEAAFHLGRLAEDVDNDPAAAARWFDTYLRDQPQGRLAAEGLGRQMVAASRSGDRMAAHALAQRYLSEHPRGSYAPVARQLTGARASSPP